MTPNAINQQASGALDIYFAAELAILALMRDMLFKNVNDKDWAAIKRKQKNKLSTGAKKILLTAREEMLMLIFAMSGAAYDQGAADMDVERRTALAASAPTIAPTGAATPSKRLASPPKRIQTELQQMVTQIERTAMADINNQYRKTITEVLQAAKYETAPQAIQRILDKYAMRGIIGFVSEGGKRHGIADYAEMATRTGVMHAAVEGYMDRAIRYGHDLVYVSNHADTCPLCAPFEHKVLSLTGKMRNHPDCDGMLMEAIAAGIFHPNCYHYLLIYEPGVTVKNIITIQTRAENDAGYKAKQRMRRYQRMVRQWRRRQTVAATPEAERLAKAYVDRWQAKIRQLTEETRQIPARGKSGPRIPLSNAARKLPTIQFNR